MQLPQSKYEKNDALGLPTATPNGNNIWRRTDLLVGLLCLLRIGVVDKGLRSRLEPNPVRQEAHWKLQPIQEGLLVLTPVDASSAVNPIGDCGGWGGSRDAARIRERGQGIGEVTGRRGHRCTLWGGSDPNLPENSRYAENADHTLTTPMYSSGLYRLCAAFVSSSISLLIHSAPRSHP